MKSLKQYIKLVEAIENPPDSWIANINIYYSFPDNNMIPQRVKNIEELIGRIMESYGFIETGSGGGFGQRDISYSAEGDDLAKILATAQKALASVNKLAKQIEDNFVKLGIVGGLEMSASGLITDDSYEYEFDFDEAEKIVRQSQQLGKK